MIFMVPSKPNHSMINWSLVLNQQEKLASVGRDSVCRREHMGRLQRQEVVYDLNTVTRDSRNSTGDPGPAMTHKVLAMISSQEQWFAGSPGKIIAPERC